MRVSSLDIFNRSVNAMLEHQALLNDVQERISLGKKNLKPSDDPTGAIRSIQLRQEIFKIDQYVDNSDTIKSYLGLEESTLNSVVSQYQRIKELAINANNASLSIYEKEAIVKELEVILSELNALANTKNGLGEYIFSGFKTENAPVALDLNGQYQYQGDEGQRKVQINDITFVDTNDTAKEIFFDLDAVDVNLQTYNQLTTVTSSSAGLVNVGSLPTLDINDLTLNTINIANADSDFISTVDSDRSAIAIAAAINQSKPQHGIDAIVNSNVLDLGIYTAQPLGANDLTINGVNIVDPTGTESSLITAINTETSTTGVIASQPGGPGTAITLTATDGRNIQLQTNGGALATFANFDLTGGALNQVQASTITLRDHQTIDIQGASPSDIGLTRGIQAPTANTGTGVMSAAVVTQPTDLDNSYSIVFNAGGTTFDVVNDANPLVPLTGFDDVAYVPGQAIEFNGLSVTINGTPNNGDVFAIDLETVASQDIFTTVQNLIDNIRIDGQNSARLAYEVDTTLINLEHAEVQLNNVRAQVGARLNVVDSLTSNNENSKFIAQQTLSKIEDLDYAEAISNLSQLTLSLQAAQQSFARIQSLSLFNFI